MKIERQIENYFTAEQRLRNGKMLLAEGNPRDEAVRNCREMIRENSKVIPKAQVTELSFDEEEFQRIFGK